MALSKRENGQCRNRRRIFKGVPITRSIGQFPGFSEGSNKLREVQILSKAAGLIPCEFYEKNLFKNVLLIGDAAGHAHPITGAGILHAVIAGELAGRVAAEAIVKEDLGVLNNYDSEWQETVGKSFPMALLKEDSWKNTGETRG